MTFDEITEASTDELRERLTTLTENGEGDSEEARFIEDELAERALSDADSLEEPWDGFLTDGEADADVLRSAGMGTDEDYGGDCERY